MVRVCRHPRERRSRAVGRRRRRWNSSRRASVGIAWSLAPLAALRDGDGDLGAVVRAGADVLDHADDLHALDDLAEHDVLVVQEIAGSAGDEELNE